MWATPETTKHRNLSLREMINASPVEPGNWLMRGQSEMAMKQDQSLVAADLASRR